MTHVATANGPADNLARMPEVTHLYAWLARDEDGAEGIVMAPIGPGGCPLPLIVADERLAREVRPAVVMASALRGEPARLVRFERLDTVDVVNVGTSRHH